MALEPIIGVVLVGGVAMAQVVSVVRRRSARPKVTQHCRTAVRVAADSFLDELESVMRGNVHLGTWTIEDRSSSNLTATLCLHKQGLLRTSLLIEWRVKNVALTGNQLFVCMDWSARLDLTDSTSRFKCERVAAELMDCTDRCIASVNSRAGIMLSAKHAGTAQRVSSRTPISKFVTSRDKSGPRTADGAGRWPSPQDYNESVQSPALFFTDQQLLKCSPELNELGIPKVSSGTFASVYRLRGIEGDWAVRCFLNPVSDQEDRYRQLSKFICADDLVYTVDFNYLSSGIKVGKSFYPVLKMHWVEGLSLHVYIESLLKRGEGLLDLQQRFRAMTADLYDGGVAHGDLQHGNILVGPDHGLVLVDYDGMFVPGMEHLESTEIGHPSYQHPARDRTHFGPYLDNFSAWLIDVCLTVVHIDPSLWWSLNGGDDCLLFHRRDLVSTVDSPVFKALLNHRERAICDGAELLLSLLDVDLRSIPALGRHGEQLRPKPLHGDDI